MRKAAFIAALLLSTLAGAQQFGFSAQALLTFQLEREYQFQNSDRIVRSGIAPAPGFRLDMNFISPEARLPASAFNGIGILYIAPAIDSAVFTARPINSWNGPVTIIGTNRTSVLNISYRCGYAIPQQFDEFMLIHIGWGFGWSRFRSQHVLPEPTATFTYTEDDFEDGEFDPVVDGSLSLEAIGGVVYEFENFSLMGQYSILFPIEMGNYSVARVRHGFTAGFFYPIYK